jgi:DNA-binding beta-propeller fold protein YncE
MQMNGIFSCVVAVLALASAAFAVELPGPRPDGSVLLPNQWSLRPAGRQVALGDFPVNVAIHPAGKYAAVLHCGYGQHEIVIVDLDSATIAGRTKLNESFYGLLFSGDGGKLYCSGAGDEVVHVFDFKDGKLSAKSDIKVCDKKQRGIPCGMALSRDGREMFVANLWGECVSRLDLTTGKNAGDLTPLPGREQTVIRTMVSKGDDDDSADERAITKRARALLDPINPDSPFPYDCRLDDSRRVLYVSLWARSEVAVVDLKKMKVSALWKTGGHPNEMLLTRSGKILYVANANLNTVSVLDTTQGRVIETLSASLSPGALPGSTPDSLALSPDEKTLYVANACNDSIVAFDVSAPGHSRSIGFIPVGWYPTSVRVTPDGRRLIVANGKGLTSLANPKGPVPGRKDPKGQYIGSLFPGALSIIDLPAGSDVEKQFGEWSKQVFECSPQHGADLTPPPPGCPVPAQPGGASPIKHCIYIIKENRTYDQLFGDMKEGNGDGNLCLFPEKITPNHHKLAREFVLLDNFYVDAEVSADGHEWSMGAYASDFVEKTWPLNYGHGKGGKFPYPGEGNFMIARPSNGYIWDRAQEAGVSYYSFGEFVSNSSDTNKPCFTLTKTLKGHFDPWFRSFDTGYRDVDRAKRFITRLGEFEAKGEMPALTILRLPNDHTAGLAAGQLSPVSMLADNDLALGMVVEAVSRSKFWPDTAIFVLEDDAQNGPDHVDAHRSPALVISPYTRSGATDSAMYSTSSMLRTIELILGLKPMTQFDEAATPMFKVFQTAANLDPYLAEPARVGMDQINPKFGYNARRSKNMDFSREDAVDDQLLNEVVWQSVKGEGSVMPAPTHAGFVFVNPGADKD